MWNEPYLETCCRSALHRLVLAGAAGRPAGLQDDGCLRRLVAMGMAQARGDGRFGTSPAGTAHHAQFVAKAVPAAAPVTPAAR